MVFLLVVFHHQGFEKTGLALIPRRDSGCPAYRPGGDTTKRIPPGSIPIPALLTSAAEPRSAGACAAADSSESMRGGRQVLDTGDAVSSREAPTRVRVCRARDQRPAYALIRGASVLRGFVCSLETAHSWTCLVTGTSDLANFLASCTAACNGFTSQLLLFRLHYAAARTPSLGLRRSRASSLLFFG